MRFVSLFSEDNQNISLGRTAFWILLGFSSYFWFKEIKFPETLYYFFSYVTLYNFGKKGLDTITDLVPLLKLGKTTESVK